MSMLFLCQTERTTICPSMPNFTLSEIATIVLVILIVFGPHRLPEMAQKAGQLVRKSRLIIADLRREFDSEWREVSEPLKDVQREVTGIKDELGSSLRSISDDVNKAKEELDAQLADTKKELEDQLKEPEVADVVDNADDTQDEEQATGDAQ